MKNIFKAFAIIALCTAAVSCEDFLNRPAEDSFTVDSYYQNDDQVIAGVNYLYNAPWYDIIRYYIYGSETMCGNVYQGQNAYTTLTVNGTDTDLKNMSYSLWAVNANCNTVINNILNSEGPSQGVKNQCIGECLAWKAMAYFMLVRTFGDVPIVHDNTTTIKEGTYNTMSKVEKADVYDYIVMTLEKAMELLPKNAYIGQYNRVDYYAAEALLAKVYLTKAGVKGTLDQDDLTKAATYAKDVINNSGRSLTPVYSDVFRGSPTHFQSTGECLFSWLWTSTSGIWTAQSSIQDDVACTGFDEFGGDWGGWKGPSVDLQDAFGVSAIDAPALRANEADTRRKATCMMFGDSYSYWWQDKGGFDVCRFFYDPDYSAAGGWLCSSGSNYAKHLYGNAYDHQAEMGVAAGNMCNQLPTHILRLADIYLVAAEALVLTSQASEALPYINAVRTRAGVAPLTAVTFDDVWKERRLELALEGDRWYDFVRRSYYDADACLAEIYAQRRSYWGGEGDTNSMTAAYKSYLLDDEGNYAGPGAHDWDGSGISYNNTQDVAAGSITASVFTLPFPTEDVVQNPNVGSDVAPVHVDVRTEYNYNF